MKPWTAAFIGDSLARVDTPALVVDLDAFERNLLRMTAALEGSGVRLRPHAKSHKCPEIAMRQVALGATGICCQKVSEAAVFVEAGIRDVLVTNQVVGETKLDRLMDLAHRARVGVLVDHPDHVRALGAAARCRRALVDVYVELDVGAQRCGVGSTREAVDLAQMVADTEWLRFAGLQCYHGPAQHVRRPFDRGLAIAQAGQRVQAAREAILDRGIPVRRVTGAGTGSFEFERDSGVWDEIQAGSYVFMDGDYAKNEAGPDDMRFEHALFVHCTVMSRPTATRAVVDAGLKASSVDSGMPAVWGRPELLYVKAADEHGTLSTADAASIALGEKILLVPGHCDPTVNLYDELVCVRRGKVEAVWPITARGALL